MEQACFTKETAYPKNIVAANVTAHPDTILAAVDKKTGRVAGMLMTMFTNEEHYSDDFFKKTELHDPHGRNVMITALEVLPEYQHHGIARELMMRGLAKAKEEGKEKVYLTCADDKLGMYERMGYRRIGLSDSTWGNQSWHEMVQEL